MSLKKYRMYSHNHAQIIRHFNVYRSSSKQKGFQSVKHRTHGELIAHVLFPRTHQSQCKVNKSLPNLETGRSKPVIYDTSRQSNLNANAFSMEPADYNLNCQADWLPSAKRVRSCRRNVEGRNRGVKLWSWIFHSVLKADWSLMTATENL